MTVCLPIINATLRDIEKGVFPKGFSLNVEVPTSPSTNKVRYYSLNIYLLVMKHFVFLLIN